MWEMSVLSIKTFPDDLHRAARVMAARRDEPLQELVIRAVRKELERLESDSAQEEQ